MTDDLLKSLWPALQSFEAEHGWDLVAAAGLTLLEAGLAMVSPWAALVALGLILIALGVWGARLWANARPTGD